VRLADDARDIVVYLGVRTGDGFAPIGTGFIVAYGEGNSVMTYLVTAAHVAKELGDAGFVVRMNNKAGDAWEQNVDDPRWILHPHEPRTVDIAILEFVPEDWARFTVWPGHAIATQNKLHEKNLGAGDLAYVVGVYTLLHGRTRNLPIVHTGHVAMMPGDEPIPTYDWNAPVPKAADLLYVSGYLVEVSTLPAISGAPVFARRSIPVGIAGDPSDPESPDILKSWMYGTVWLLGVWHGAWMGDPSDLIRELFFGHGEDPKVSLNMGIAMPATRLVEIFERPDLVARRADMRQARDRIFAVTPQSVRIARTDDDVLTGDDILKNMLTAPPDPRPAPKKGRRKR
jgi:hypothetical protein